MDDMDDSKDDNTDDSMGDNMDDSMGDALAYDKVACYKVVC